MSDPRDPARGGLDPVRGEDRYDRPGPASRYAPQGFLPPPPVEDSDPTAHRAWGPDHHPADEDQYDDRDDIDVFDQPDVGDGLDEHDLYDAPEQGHDAGAPASTWSSRRQVNGHRRTARRRRLRSAVVLLLALAVVAGAGAVALDKIKPLLTLSSDSGDYPGPGTGSVDVTVANGDTATAIGATLEKAGVVKTAKAFAQAAAADPKGTSIQPGGYTLRSQMTAAAALAVLVDPANRTVPRVTVREGLWKSETFAVLAKASGRPVSDYVTAAKDAAGLGLPAAAKGNVEGWLFPATYEFPTGSSAAEQLQAMVAKTVEQLTSLGVAEGDTEKVLTIASIVQAEGRRPEDLPKIARVVDNRLALRMRLQLDSTVSYGVQKRALTTTDAERARSNGYNTYARDGLPVGPISNPGAAAIQAAQAPADGPWLYFVAVNPKTGETKFATTASEHAANVAQFQRWCADHPGTC